MQLLHGDVHRVPWLFSEHGCTTKRGRSHWSRNARIDEGLRTGLGCACDYVAIYGHPHRSHTCLFPMYRSCIQPLAHTLMTHAFVYLTSRSFTHPTCSRCHAHLYTPRACTRPQISLINRPNTSSGVNAITGNYRPDTASAIAAVMVCKTMRPNDTVLLVHVEGKQK